MAAPTALFDDEWSTLGDLNMVSDQMLLPRKGRAGAAGEAAVAPQHDGSVSPGETGAFKSVEDLVKDFDGKLSVCFRNPNNAKTDSIAPLSVITEDALLEKDE